MAVRAQIIVRTMKTDGEIRRTTSLNQPLSCVSRRFSIRSRRYKKLASSSREELCESLSAKSNSLEGNTRVTSTEGFNKFAINRFKASREAAAKFNAAVDEVDERVEEEKETLPVRCRRHAICEEMERNILNDAGISLRGYRELLVTRRLLFEMHLL